MSHKNRRVVATGLSAVLLATLLTGLNQLVAESASATTSDLVTAPNRDGLADAIADEYFSGGAPFAVVAQDSDEAVHLAGTYAARFEAPVVVSASGTSATAALAELDDLGATHVVLVSSTAAWFSSGFQADIATASIAQDAYYQSGDLFTRWRDAAGVAANEYALARSDNSDGMVLATAYAASRGIPLVLWESTTSGSLLEDFFEDTESAQLVFFGTDNVPADQMSDTRYDTLSTVDLADPQRAFVWVASQGQLAGSVSNGIFAAPSDENDELALAGVAAAKAGGIVAPAGASTSLTTGSRLNEYLTLWKSGAGSVALLGTGLVAGDMTTVMAPTTTSHATNPAFRVSGFTQGSTTFTLTVTAVAGATAYTLYDAMGATLDTSSSPSLTYTGEVSGALVVADGSSGELARIDVHFNFYDQTSTLNGMLTVDASGGTNHIRIMSDIATPRLITRAVNDYFSEFPSFGEPVPIAITCSNDFTDVTGDATKEYEYEVVDFTNVDVSACGSFPADPATGDERADAKVSAPPTEFPWMRASGEATRAAGVTYLQSAITDAIEDQATGGDDAERGPGDDWSPITTRWIAYIPEAKILFPGRSTDLLKPFFMFGGDSHGTNNPNGSYRFRQDMTFYFGSSHTASYAEAMGTTHLYKCTWPTGSGCSLVDSDTASLTELSNPSLTHGATWARGRITAQAKNPLVPIAPPITTDVTVYLSDVTSWVKGYHDNMPKHEFYTGPVFSEYYKAYESSYLSYAVQLPCLGAPEFEIPGCLVYFNAQI